MSISEKVLSSPKIKIRIEQLSDLVFGLALSIGSLELIARTPRTPLDIGVSVALFAFSFLIVVSLWIGYTRIMAITTQEAGGAVSLNLLLLFCLVLEPYLFFILQSSEDLDFLNWASFGYALDVGGMFLILGGLTRLALRKKTAGSELHPMLFRRFRVSMMFWFLIGGCYVLSALPFFWVDTAIGPLRFVFWYSAFGFFFLQVANRYRERTGPNGRPEHLAALRPAK